MTTQTYLSKSLKRPIYNIPVIFKCFMANKTPSYAKNHRESTKPGTRQKGNLFSFFRQATVAQCLPQSLMIVFAQNSSIFNWAVQRNIAYPWPPSLLWLPTPLVCHAIFLFVHMHINDHLATYIITSVKNIKNVWRCRDNRTAKSMKTSRDDGIKQFSVQHHLTYLST